jgi:hypothetical protein
MTEGTTSGAETTYPSATPKLTLRFSLEFVCTGFSS